MFGKQHMLWLKEISMLSSHQPSTVLEQSGLEVWLKRELPIQDLMTKQKNDFEDKSTEMR